MYVRMVMINTDPAKVDSVADFIEGTARPQVEATPGNKGFACFTGADTPVAVAASYWADAETLQASNMALAELRDRAMNAAEGSLGVDEFEVMIGFRQTIPARGASVRLSRMQMDPSVVEDVVAFTRENSVPRVKGAAGLCSFQWLINRDTGMGMVATAWEDQKSAEDFWGTAEDLRNQVGDRYGVTFGGREDYRMVQTTVQLG